MLSLLYTNSVVKHEKGAEDYMHSTAALSTAMRDRKKEKGRRMRPSLFQNTTFDQTAETMRIIVYV